MGKMGEATSPREFSVIGVVSTGVHLSFTDLS
jgi:hypothetical protein